MKKWTRAAALEGENPFFNGFTPLKPARRRKQVWFRKMHLFFCSPPPQTPPFSHHHPPPGTGPRRSESQLVLLVGPARPFFPANGLISCEGWIEKGGRGRGHLISPESHSVPTLSSLTRLCWDLPRGRCDVGEVGGGGFNCTFGVLLLDCLLYF